MAKQRDEHERVLFYFILFYFSSLIFLIHRVSIVGIRRAKSESSSTRRGLRVSTKNTKFRLKFK